MRKLKAANEKKSRAVVIFSQSKFDKLIPKEGLELLPLKPEPINSWDVSNLDVIKFLKHLFNKQAEFISAEGRKEKANYQFYWRTIFEAGLKEFQDFAEEFELETKKYRPAPASIIKKVETPSFLDDKFFGIVSKYYIIYDGILDEVLSESHFFSVAHILESLEELNCSILLSKKLYYKQSLQVLRNYIESMVSQILFCDNSRAFEDWRNGTFKLPRLCGKGGLLDKLSNANLISLELSKRVSNLYAHLNSYIHGSEGRLIHRGAYEGKYKGFIFDYDYFKIWCKFFSDVVETGVLLLDAHLEQFSRSRKKGIICSICHNKKDFEVKEEEFAGQTYVKLRCKKCNSEMTIKK